MHLVPLYFSCYIHTYKDINNGKKMKEPYLRITPLGGLGEIGLNCQKWETEEGLILMDCGLMFPDDNHLGIDVVIPRFESLVVDPEKVLGVVLTHGHEDHIGALPWLLRILRNIKIYGSAFTLALVEHKLTERGLLDRAELILVEPYDIVSIGSLKIQAIPVCHSIPGGFAFLIDSPIGKVVHTGDFKLDKNSAEYPLESSCAFLADLKDFAKDGDIRLLLSDSTNVETKGHSVSESEVKNSLDTLFEITEGRIVIALFASHIQRIRSVFELAQKYNKTVIVSGRSLSTNIHIAEKLGILSPSNVFYEMNNLPELDRNKTVVLATGTQGEALSALTRIAHGEHRKLALHKGDTVIMSSRVIPGNARAVSRVINQMYRQGATVFHDQRYTLHATGHACYEELAEVLNITKPQCFIPIHGEYRHMAQHAELAKKCGIEHPQILEDGQPICIYKTTEKLEDKIPVECVLVDGKGVGDVGRLILKERRILSTEGIVIVSLVIDGENQSIIEGPHISSKGFVFTQQYSHFLQEAQCIILEQFEASSGKNLNKLSENIRIHLRRFFRDVIGRDPIIESMITII